MFSPVNRTKTLENVDENGKFEYASFENGDENGDEKINWCDCSHAYGIPSPSGFILYSRFGEDKWRRCESACLSRNILLRFENENGDFLKRISVVRALDRLLCIGNIPEKKLGWLEIRSVFAMVIFRIALEGEGGS